MNKKELQELNLKIDELCGYSITKEDDGLFVRSINMYPMGSSETKTIKSAQKKLVPDYTGDIEAALSLFNYPQDVLCVSISKEKSGYVAQYIIWSRFQNNMRPTILVSDTAVSTHSFPHAISMLWLKLRNGDAWSVLKYLENKVA